MTYVSSLCAIAGIYLLAAASPGPNFFTIGQYALAGRRRLSVLAALGVCLGSVSWAVVAMAGVAALMAKLPWLQSVIRVAGAIYLVGFLLLLVWRLRRAYRLPAVAAPQDLRGFAAFRIGFLTSITNPKSGVFWTSMFGGALPPEPPLWFLSVTTLLIAAIAASWYVSVALVLGKAHVQSLFGRLRRGAAALLAAFSGLPAPLTAPTRRQVP
jgi:threonine/homoserine/homoserine lactone efflux protein